jgi:hypothetical protein
MKETYYFRHDTNATQDPKMISLLMECGLMGIGAFWVLVEIMHQQKDGAISKEEFKKYLNFYGKQGVWSDAVISLCERLLFTTKLFIEKGGKITSERVIENLKTRNALSNRGKSNIQKRWFGNTKRIPKCIPNRYQNDTIKKRKEKNIYPPISPNGFDDFWNMYPNKVGKVKAHQSWVKINPDEELRNKIMVALANHRKSVQWIKDGGEFIPHPTTWLNQRRWEDQLRSIQPEVDPNIENKMKIKKKQMRDMAEAEYQKRVKKDLPTVSTELSTGSEIIKNALDSIIKNK